MSFSINGVVVSDDDIDAELEHHLDAPNPRDAAACALAVRELLLQRAQETGLADEAGITQCEALIETLLEREAPVPQPSDEECRQCYEQHRERYVSGELVEASHILFAVTPNAPLEAIRHQAETTLKQVREAPERFAEFAERLSSCPSAAQGGRLGRIHRGERVPEFEATVFGAETGVLPRLVNTRYGFHIVRVERHIPGKPLDFEIVRPHIANALAERMRAKAAEQFVRILAAQAAIEGIDLDAASSALAP